MSLTITNLSSERLVFSGCFYHIERQSLYGKWHVIYEDDNPCPAVLTYLEPLASLPASVTLPDDLGSGVYRVRFPSIGSDSGGEAFIVAQQIGGSFRILER